MPVIIGRRELIAALGGAAVWPLAALAQQGEGMRLIGVLSGFVVDDPEGQACLHYASLGRRIVSANSKVLFVTHIILWCDLG